MSILFCYASVSAVCRWSGQRCKYSRQLNASACQHNAHSAGCGTITLLHPGCYWLCGYDCSSAGQRAGVFVVAESLLFCPLWTSLKLRLVVSGVHPHYSDRFFTVKTMHQKYVRTHHCQRHALHSILVHQLCMHMQPLKQLCTFEHNRSSVVLSMATSLIAETRS